VYGKTKFIVFDGMDDCGKSTMIQDLQRDFWPHAKEIKFPKTLPSGALLRMNTEKDFEILFTMFELLDKNKTYLLDRFMVSNLVYDKVLRGESTELSTFYYDEFRRRFNVREVFVTRPHISSAFIDDRIKLTREQFNAGIDEYKKYGTNYQVLSRNDNDEPNGLLPIRAEVMKACFDFVRPTGWT
jgi:thymidylate kinase